MSATIRAWLLFAALAASFPARAAAEDFRLSAPRSLVETGFLKYVLPRFSLKTGVRINLVGAGAEAELALAPEGAGRAVFSGQGQTWRLNVLDRDHADAARFVEWLTSDIGRRTISGFKPGDAALFTPAAAGAGEAAKIDYDGDIKRGLALSQEHCRRCHAVSEKDRLNTIGSTPSFFVLRTFGDWDVRFQSFYVLNPHPAFTQVEGVTVPFPVNRPPPIVPVEITLDELEDIMAYVAKIAPADLGKPLDHQ